MTDELDPRLQALFTEARQDLDGAAFSSGVMARTRFLKYRLPAGLIGIALVSVICAFVIEPSLQDFAVLIAQTLTNPLIDLGEGLVGWVFSPVNNIGSLIILGVKAIRMYLKKIQGAVLMV